MSTPPPIGEPSIHDASGNNQTRDGSSWPTRTTRLADIAPTLWRGMKSWLAEKNLSREFWIFFAAAFFFDLGLYIFFLLYNLYLLDRGFKESFLGLVTSASAIGSVAGTIPAGILVQHVGLRKALLLCVVLVSLIFGSRAVLGEETALLAFSFLGGAVFTIWAVCISPVVAQLTSPQNRAFGFSLIFSSGIGIGVLGGQIGGHLPDWLARIGPSVTPVHAKQLALLIACGMVVVAIWPIACLRFASAPAPEKKFYPRSPFLLRYLPAIALWSLAIGAFSPFFNVYLSQHLRMPVKQIGTVFSVSQLAQVLAILAAPVIFRKFGLVSGIMYTQMAAALALGCLSAVPQVLSASTIFVGYTAFQWMSEPGMFTLLMNQVAASERTGASALNFLVINLSQAVAAMAAGASFARFGYPTVLGVTAGVGLVAACLFRLLLGRDSLPVSQDLPAGAGA
jgi:MFS family permease